MRTSKPSPHLIRLSQVGKEIKDHKDTTKQLLNDVTWELGDGERVALISTSSLSARAFLDCAAGVVLPQKGAVTINANISWPLGARGGLLNNLSARQNMSLLHGVYGEYGKLNRDLDFVSELAGLDKIFFNRPIRNYNKLMRSRFFLAASLAFDFDAYMIPKTFAWASNANSERALRFQDVLSKRVEGKSLLMAHNDFNILERFCTDGIVLDQGEIILSGSLQDCRTWWESHIGSKAIDDDTPIESSDDDQNQISSDGSEDRQSLDDDLW